MNSAKVERAYEDAVEQALGTRKNSTKHEHYDENPRFIDVAGPKLIPDDDDPNT